MTPSEARAPRKQRRAVARRRAGFTLIEILAVLVILGLVAAFVVPNMGGFRRRALRNEAQQLASQLELARQRAIVTGVPHRVWLELDQAEYRLQGLAGQSGEAAGAPPAPEPRTKGQSPQPPPPRRPSQTPRQAPS